MPTEQISINGVQANRVALDESAKVYHMPAWKTMSDPARIAALREITLGAGRDPRLATLAVQILRQRGVRPREHKRAAAALLEWVQTRIFYVNEPGERLQDPLYTLRVCYGDCDDMAILLAALFECLRLPWRFVISGRTTTGKLIRWVEGTPYQHASWGHIYLCVGDRPFTPKRWLFAEPTLKKPLGWDVVRASRGGSVELPELAGIEDATEPTQAKPLTVDGVVSDIRKELQPRKLIVGLIVSLVTGTIAAIAIRPLIARVTRTRRRR